MMLSCVGFAKRPLSRSFRQTFQASNSKEQKQALSMNKLKMAIMATANDIFITAHSGTSASGHPTEQDSVVVCLWGEGRNVSGTLGWVHLWDVSFSRGWTICHYNMSLQYVTTITSGVKPSKQMTHLISYSLLLNTKKM